MVELVMRVFCYFGILVGTPWSGPLSNTVYEPYKSEAILNETVSLNHIRLTFSRCNPADFQIIGSNYMSISVILQLSTTEVFT